mmetsp:Transcript_28616/g.84722  ORF Transcript_28616/g.84722 Transcript_28616/m.84722 type:complete len:117 (-) Transcript_28616:370-720(-)
MARGMGLVALPSASSGIAGILLEGGSTAHSRFKIPIDVPHLGYCDIGGNTMLANVLRKASVFVWDEAQAAVCDKWASDLLDIGDSVGAKMFKVPKYMIVKGHGLETDDVTALIAKI